MKRLFLLLSLVAATGAHALDGPRRVIINGNVPNWVTQNWGSLAPLISWDYDFQHNRCYIQGAGQVSCDSILSTSRASNAICAQNNGTLISVGSNTRCWTDQGLLIQEARTNKCTNYNANPTDLTNVTKSGDAAATLTVVDDTAALAAAGLQNIATSGMVYKLDNSAGTGDAAAVVTGTTTNLNTHALSGYVRGSGNAEMRLTFGTLTATALTSTYVRRTTIATPAATNAQFTVIAKAGAVVWFTLNQLEEGAFVTSPIVVAGSSATRAADVISLTGQAATKALAAKTAFFQTNGVAGGVAPRIFDGGVGLLVSFSSTTQVQTNAAGNLATATIGGSGTYSGVVKTAVAWDGSSVTVLANAGTKATNANAGVVSSPVYVGNNSSGIRSINGYMQRSTGSAFKGLFDNSTRVQ